jgi:hypothetical protein
MFVLQELPAHVTWHRYVKRARSVIPMEFYPTVKISGPVFNKLVFCFLTGHEVIGMFLSNVFYSEIVHDKGERDGSPFVAP